ncbi:MAG: aspartate/glutamate racemase family protein, partial [Sphaerochaetaceae bacterium]|nr:aspartate/glutamate racemase family protein [Sphaerochaetaceae bacterium]
GSSAIGIGCNTAHSPKILSQIKFPNDVEFINMIEETCNYVSSIGGSIEKPFKVGLLATLGTIKTGIYKQYFDKHEELELVLPSNKTCEKVHNAIYNKEYGIKAVSPVSAIANEVCRVAIDELSLLGCKAVILGCTELPLVFSGLKEYNNTVLVDPTDILAQSLVKAVSPEKFKV